MLGSCPSHSTRSLPLMSFLCLLHPARKILSNHICTAKPFSSLPTSHSTLPRLTLNSSFWNLFSTECRSYSVWAAIRKYHRLRGLTDRHVFLMVLEDGNARSIRRQILLLVRALFLACTQPPSCLGLTGPFLSECPCRANTLSLFLFL